MQNFNYSIPTKVYFGKGQIKKLSKISQFGTKVLMVYGGGSIKGNGIYDKAAAVLRESGVSFLSCQVLIPILGSKPSLWARSYVRRKK